MYVCLAPEITNNASILYQPYLIPFSTEQRRMKVHDEWDELGDYECRLITSTPTQWLRTYTYVRWQSIECSSYSFLPARRTGGAMARSFILCSQPPPTVVLFGFRQIFAPLSFYVHLSSPDAGLLSLCCPGPLYCPVWFEVAAWSGW